jgi:hypothetical protein
VIDDRAYLASRFAFFGMGMQALSGICFDQEAARNLVTHIQEEMAKIEAEVEPQLPPRRLKKSEEANYTLPAKPYKKDGTLSATMLKWFEKHGVVEFKDGYFKWIDGTFHTIKAQEVMDVKLPMTLANQDDLKSWLQEQGWESSLWNYQKDERGKPIRDKKTGGYIQTSPKMQDQGRLCPNLEAMSGELVRPIVRWLSLRNRYAVVSTWLADERLAYDGCLSAGAAGLASSHRFRHTVVVNVPKAEDGVTLGKEMRSLFIARPGRVFVGYDASGIEARVEGHYCYPYDGGEAYAQELINGDIHLKTTAVVYHDKVKDLLGTEDFHKDHPLVKPWRSKAKNLKYASSYGAQAKKIASMLGCTVGEAEIILARFWEAAKPLAQLKQKLQQFWETTGEKKWIKGVDGRRLFTRSPHSLVNLLFQSCGAAIMDYAGIYMNKWLGGWTVDNDLRPCYNYKGHTVYRVLFQHDEYGYDAPEEIADEIGQMGCRSIEQAGRYLKIRVPTGGEYKIGTSWKDTH